MFYFLKKLVKSKLIMKIYPKGKIITNPFLFHSPFLGTKSFPFPIYFFNFLLKKKKSRCEKGKKKEKRVKLEKEENFIQQGFQRLPPIYKGSCIFLFALCSQNKLLFKQLSDNFRFVPLLANLGFFFFFLALLLFLCCS